MKEKDLVRKIACVRDVAGVGKDVYPLALACALMDASMALDEGPRPGGESVWCVMADKENSA